MSMLLFVTHRLWSIFGDSGSVVSSVVSSNPALLSFHMLTGNLDRAPWRLARVAERGAHAHDWPLRTPAGLAQGSRAPLEGGPDRAFLARHPQFAGALAPDRA